MTAKQYLAQIQRLDAVIKKRRREQDELMESAVATGGFDYSKGRVQVSPPGDAPYTQAVGRLIDLDAEVERLEMRFAYMTAKMDGIIEEALTVEEAFIIRLRYYYGWKWGEIVEASESRPSTVFRRHGRALEKLDSQYIVEGLDVRV